MKTKLIALGLLLSAGLYAAEIAGKWDMVWSTPGGERKSVLTVTVEGETVRAELSGSKEPIPGTFKDGELKLNGKLFSAEAGMDGEFKLSGKLEGEQLKGSASWEEHQMTFTATKVK